MKKTFCWLLFAALTIGSFSCKDDSSDPIEVKARFTVTNDEIDGFKVNIVNDSQNATEYSWSFGDDSTGTQSDSAFSHTYAAAGTYTITLTAKNGTVTNVSTKEVTISGMTLKQFLSGTAAGGKIWYLDFDKLISMYNPDDVTQWWYGWSSLPSVDQRNVVRHHEYIFKPDGSFEFVTNGYTVRPVSAILFGDAPETKGWSDDVSWTNGDGFDCSTWGNNANLTFAIGDATKYLPSCTNRITISGKGGHIGPMDTGTELVVDDPASEVFYEVLKYIDGGNFPDTIVLYSPWGGNENGLGTTRPGLGVITLVSYKSADQIPADEIVTEKPLATYDIYDNFDDAAVNIAWVQDNSPTSFDESFDNPDKTGINTSNKVAKYVRGTQDYANLQFELSFRMNLSTRNVFKMKVYIDNAAAVKTVAVKLQDSKQGGNAWQTQTEVKQADLTSGSWIELTFDFSSVSTNTLYDKIVVQFGDEGAAKGDGIFYFDDFQLQ
jgi:PKD repeat protein